MIYCSSPSIYQSNFNMFKTLFVFFQILEDIYFCGKFEENNMK